MTLRSTHAQKVAGRNLIRVARALYTIDVILHAIGDQDDAEQVERVVASRLNDVSTRLKADTKQLRTQREECGIDDDLVYNHPISLTFRISSPQLAQYAAMIQELDALTVESDALWMSGILSNRKHAAIAYDWRRILLDLAYEILDIERLARASAFRDGRGEELVASDAVAKQVVTVDGGDEDDLADEDEDEAP